MRGRDKLIDETRATLAKAGFALSEPHAVQSICFDLVARRDDEILIVKILANIDSLKRESSEELRILATTLGASPLIIGTGAGGGKLEQGVIYSRHLIPIMTIDTLRDFLIEEVPPFIYAAPGGFYVRIDGERLDTIRTTNNISLGTLAEVAGVSRRTIQLYCEGAGAMIDAVLKIEKFLNAPLIVPLNPLRYTQATVESLRSVESLEGLQKDVVRRLQKLGYDVTPTVRCPFDALAASGRQIILTGIEGSHRQLVHKARAMKSISSVVRRETVIFVSRRRTNRDNIEGAPIISREELQKIDDSDRILTLIEERRRR